MTIREIEKEIAEMENRKFALDFKDIWNYEDFEKYDAYCLRVKELNNKLDKVKEKIKDIKLEDLGIGD